MTYRELVCRISEALDIPKALVKDVIQKTVKEIKDSLDDGDRILIPGLGVFSTRPVKARKFNSIEGKVRTCRAHKSPKFRFSKSIRATVK